MNAYTTSLSYAVDSPLSAGVPEAGLSRVSEAA